MIKRATRKFNKKRYFLTEIELTKTAARMEARKARSSGNYARVTPQKGGIMGKFSVWERRRPKK